MTHAEQLGKSVADLQNAIHRHCGRLVDRNELTHVVMALHESKDVAQALSEALGALRNIKDAQEAAKKDALRKDAEAKAELEHLQKGEAGGPPVRQVKRAPVAK